MENEEKLFANLRCPICRGELKNQHELFICLQCNNQYPVIDGIIDFYPPDTPFKPEYFNLRDKYEEFGGKISRHDTFQNKRRKKITMEMVHGENVLEIGTAEGWMTGELVKRAKRVVSCDIALSYLKRARMAGIKAEFMRVDAHSLPFADNTFDCIIMTEVLEHLYSPYRALEEVYRLLTSNGCLILSTPNNMTLSNFLMHLFNIEQPVQDAHLSFYDVISLKRLLGFAGFSTKKVKTNFIYIPLIKPLFFFDIVQSFLQLFLKNFGDKIILQAEKTTETQWHRL